MPTINISDKFSAEILTAPAGPGSGISKYFKGDPGFIAAPELVAALNKPIAALPQTAVGLGLSFKTAGTFGATNADWGIKAGAQIAIGASQAGKIIPGDDLFGDPIKVAADRTVLTVVFTPSLSVEASESVGDLKFGFSGGATVEFRTGRTFDAGQGKSPKLGDALKEILTTGIIPGDLADLKAMNAGDISSVSGSGQFKANASVDLAAALNPLTTPQLGLKQIGSLELKAGASLVAEASIGFKGRYQVRVMKLDAQRVRLGYYRMKGSQFDFSVTAKAGVTATLGKKELIELIAGFSSAPKPDIQKMVEEGLSEDQIARLRGAIAASVNRTLAVSLAGSFGIENEDSASFEYEFELDKLDLGGTDALHSALDGDLSPLTSRESTDMPAGVKQLKSELDTFKKKSITWKINLLGIVNVLHVTELISKGKTLFDPESGELVIADSTTGNNITVVSRPFEADTQKLREVLMQSMIMTSAYRVAGVQKFLNFNGSMTYYKQLANISARDVSDFLDDFLGLELIDLQAKHAFLNGTFAGRGSVFLELTFDDAAFEAMFIDGNGDAFKQETYDAFGRECIAALIQPGDEHEFRRIPMLPENDDLWNTMTDRGQFQMRLELPAELQAEVPFAMVSHDYTVIRWWSDAMSRAGKQVIEMKQFLKDSNADAESLKDDKTFKKKLKDLEGALANVVSHSQPEFLDAWGLLAMDRAAARKSGARGILITTGSVLVKNR